ncbi:ABC transporter-like [Syntrophomonas zehnderi OL-4]|uniref:ABC transporter-like n=1 Tax=Syntrophomonas zehnderi OL-4 TaxID=690567 RepID=A0A0E4GA92_9FIRM|nr:ABC transporter ATP-binding protein [Syntrophomonas zehnderi]CFX06184.1 ABC transporter-like [Syntrophomonas zehnderi OL-4]CFX33633.1 ABC transporter-like [Syntrophomonas zehnderi OL-4]
MIELSGITKHYEELEALNQVSLSVQKGSIYGLVGSNGAGKTTLLKLLAGILRPDAGDICIDSQPVYENIEIKNRLLLIPDYIYFFFNFSIQDMADFYAKIYPQWNQERFDKLQAVFNIDNKRRIQTLSKGMQRQVAFWLSLSAMPDYLILDEPLDGLDPVMRQKVKNLIIQDVADRDMTVIISSHNLRELEDICDCIGILHKGKMLMQRDLDDLKSDLHKIQVAFKDDLPAAWHNDIQAVYQEKRGRVTTLIVRGAREEIIRRIKAHNPAIIDVLPLTLEEIFIYEMGDNGYEIKNILY